MDKFTPNNPKKALTIAISPTKAIKLAPTLSANPNPLLVPSEIASIMFQTLIQQFQHSLFFDISVSGSIIFEIINVLNGTVNTAINKYFISIPIILYPPKILADAEQNHQPSQRKALILSVLVNTA